MFVHNKMEEGNGNFLPGRAANERNFYNKLLNEQNFSMKKNDQKTKR